MASAEEWAKSERSLLIAYVLWLCGGCLGLQHLYLDRPVQAGLWACSPLGAFFGWGVLRDLLRLPHYAAVRNCSPAAQEQLEVEMKYQKVPPWTLSRMIGAYLWAHWFGFVGSCCGPAWLPEVYFVVTASLAAGVGAWLAGTACTHQSGSLKATVGAALVGGPASGYAAAAAVTAFQCTRRWEPEPLKRRPKCWQVLAAVLLFWSAAVYGAAEHCSITISDGPGGEPKTFMLKDTIANILRGFDLSDFSFHFEDWEGQWNSLLNALDVQGERRALKALNMSEFIGKEYTAANIKRNYRKLAMQWHPDKIVAGVTTSEAEARMQEINEAKEVLYEILQNRADG